MVVLKIRYPSKTLPFKNATLQKRYPSKTLPSKNFYPEIRYPKKFATFEISVEVHFKNLLPYGWVYSKFATFKMLSMYREAFQSKIAIFMLIGYISKIKYK